MKSVSEVLLQRRSIRRYERESIPEETMQFVYDAIRNTSTSYNGQQFSVIDIDNQEIKEALYALTNQKQIRRAIIFSFSVRIITNMGSCTERGLKYLHFRTRSMA